MDIHFLPNYQPLPLQYHRKHSQNGYFQNTQKSIKLRRNNIQMNIFNYLRLVTQASAKTKQMNMQFSITKYHNCNMRPVLNQQYQIIPLPEIVMDERQCGVVNQSDIQWNKFMVELFFFCRFYLLPVFLKGGIFWSKFSEANICKFHETMWNKNRYKFQLNWILVWMRDGWNAALVI